MPGFWDGFEKPERVTGDYLTAGDLVGETLYALEVKHQPDNTFNGNPSPRFLVRVMREDESEGLVPIAAGYEARDATMRAMLRFLEADGDPIPFTISKIGRFLDINPVEEE